MFADVTNACRVAGSGSPPAPVRIAQMHRREWSPKNNAPSYASGRELFAGVKVIAEIASPPDSLQASPGTTS